MDDEAQVWMAAVICTAIVAVALILGLSLAGSHGASVAGAAQQEVARLHTCALAPVNQRARCVNLPTDVQGSPGLAYVEYNAVRQCHLIAVNDDSTISDEQQCMVAVARAFTPQLQTHKLVKPATTKK